MIAGFAEALSSLIEMRRREGQALGAVLSGLATSQLGAWVLLPPFLILLALALVWVPLA